MVFLRGPPKLNGDVLHRELWSHLENMAIIIAHFDRFCLILYLGYLPNNDKTKFFIKLDAGTNFGSLHEIGENDPSTYKNCYAPQNLIHFLKRWRHKKTFFFFFHFSVLDTCMYRWSMMKNIHSQNLVGIVSWGPKIWPHEYLISPIEISVNWPGFKQLWTRSIILHWFQWG